MKILSTLLLCFCSTGLFAQNGFFLQPEVSLGNGNVHWSSTAASPEYGRVQHNISSYEGTLEVGYKHRNFEFVTGVGYFRTGYWGKGINGVFPNWIGAITDGYPKLGDGIVYNSHIILPVKFGYQLLGRNRRFVVTPYLGAEFAYNLPRLFVGLGQEPLQDFSSYCYRYGVFGLAELNLRYKICNRVEFSGGLSSHYSLTPLVRDHQEFDYAMLANLGMRYNFGHK